MKHQAMKVLRIMLVAMSLYCLAPTVSVARTPVESLPGVDTSRCTPLEWVSPPGLPAQYAVKVPVKINGRNYWFQLDTGSWYTMLYAPAKSHHHPLRSGARQVVKVDDIRLGGMDLGPYRLPVNERISSDGGIVGVVGLNLLVGHVAILNFRNQQFCLLDESHS